MKSVEVELTPTPEGVPVGVGGVTLHRLPVITDVRGNLSVGEFERQIPFVPKRYFLVFDVPSMETRGEHAHHSCEEFLICVRGSCSVLVDDGRAKREIRLDHHSLGLNLPPMVWRVHHKYTADAMLLALASTYYEPGDYIRDYKTFLRLTRDVA